MNAFLTDEEAQRAKDLIRSYYAEQLLARVREVSKAQGEAVAAAEALEGFNLNEALPDASDSIGIAVWAGSRAIRATAREIGGSDSAKATDATYDERLMVLRWLASSGYAIGDEFLKEIESDEGRR